MHTNCQSVYELCKLTDWESIKKKSKVPNEKTKIVPLSKVINSNTWCIWYTRFVPKKFHVYKMLTFGK